VKSPRQQKRGNEDGIVEKVDSWRGEILCCAIEQQNGPEQNDAAG
jgi:hypothetical protein